VAPYVGYTRVGSLVALPNAKAVLLYSCLIRFFCSTAPQAFFRPDRSLPGHRAQRRSMTAPLGAAVRLVIDGREHDGTLVQNGCARSQPTRCPSITSLASTSKSAILLTCAGAPWVIKAEDLASFASGKRQKPPLTPNATQQVFDFQ
jgi:hypothetical protein